MIGHRCSRIVLLAFALGLAGLLIGACGGVLQRLALLQWQQPRAAGVLTLQLRTDGALVSLGQAVSRQRLLPMLQLAAQRRGWRALRLMPAPGVAWADVLQLARQLQQRGFPLELQLPAS